MATRKRKSEPISVYTIMEVAFLNDTGQLHVKSGVIGVYKCSHRHIKNRVRQLERASSNPRVCYFISEHQIEIV